MTHHCKTMELNGAKRKEVIEFSLELTEKIQNSLNVLNEAFQTYEINQLFLSFNGGKDCTVLLNLIKEHLSDKIRSLKVIYLRQKSPFPEIESFVLNCEIFYGISINTIEADAPLKEILTEVCKKDQDLSACIMGSRRSDPYCEKLKSFEPTDSDQNWPKLMRVNPLLDWNCANIWEYLLKNDVPYCSLYNSGFTSIGNMNNTVPNPHLKISDDQFRPAYELLDDTLERAGRG